MGMPASVERIAGNEGAVGIESPVQKTPSIDRPMRLAKVRPRLSNRPTYLRRTAFCRCVLAADVVQDAIDSQGECHVGIAARFLGRGNTRTEEARRCLLG